ncbi:MAG: mechanosensitive ion channel [Bacteroidales bacterium]|nr:mechanosensitive ion channel [Bacteroidales bacterium]
MTDFLIEIFSEMSDYLMATFRDWGWAPDTAKLFNNIINFILIGCVSALSWVIAKFIIIRIVHEIVTRTVNKYDDLLVTHKVVEPLSQIFPAAYIYYLIQFAVSDPEWVDRIRSLCYSWNVFSLIIILFRAIDAVHDILADILMQKGRKTNIRGYVQVAKIIIGLFGGFGIISILIGQNPLSLFGGLAGISALLMLVFKDSISGFVASIQLTSLDMVKMNDWITMAGRNIEGNVVEITLNTIKVRNFDNSVVTVPTANLMMESFINWSNMQDMEARRIKRTIMIDANSVSIASQELINRAKNIPIMTEYVEQRIQETADHNDNLQVFGKQAITNLELFRKYIEFYIRANFQVFKKFKPKTITITSEEKPVAKEEGIAALVASVTAAKNDKTATLGKSSKTYTLEVYPVDDKEDFIKLFGEGAVEYLKDFKGHTIIKDIDKFTKDFKDDLVVDKKDKKVYYPVKRTKAITYINNKLKPTEVKTRIIIKDGTFVENGHLMVRQMQQTSTGIPLEVYCFTKITEWASFEKIQSAFFEHLFAVIKEFGLKTYQLSRDEVREAGM